jgi:hypothetical protein
MLVASVAVPASPTLKPATPGLQKTPMPPTQTPGERAAAAVALDAGRQGGRLVTFLSSAVL